MIKPSEVYQFILIAIGVIIFNVGCSNIDLKAKVVIPPSFKLVIQNYCPTAGFNYVDHFVYNSSAYFNINQWTTDTDRDGLPDFFEQSLVNFTLFGTSYLSSDTSGNGYSDLTKIKMGLNAGQQSVMPICANQGVDTDHDGLSDCEEALLGTDPTLADSDLDGIPDGLEIRFGTNPNDPRDSLTATSGDGITNLDKIKKGVTVATFLNSDSLATMPVYTSSPSTKSSQQNCYNFEVSNLSILPVKNGNILQAVVLEDSQNPPIGGTQAVLRVARTLTILVPSTIAQGSTVVVSDGIHGQFVDGVTIPLVIVGGGS